MSVTFVQGDHSTGVSFSDAVRSEEAILRKPTKAMLFDPVARETGVTVYDRANPDTLQTILGGHVMTTPIYIDSVVRWVVHSRADGGDGGCQYGIAMRIILAGEDQIFYGSALLAGKRVATNMTSIWICFGPVSSSDGSAAMRSAAPFAWARNIWVIDGVDGNRESS